MADKWKSNPEDEPIHGTPNEGLRGIADDDDVDFDAVEVLADDEEEEEEEEEGSRF